MKVTIDYAALEGAAKRAKAVADVKNYFGDRYEIVEPLLRGIIDARSFGIACGFAGIEGYPVRALYDHLHGEGAYERWWDEHEAAGAKTETRVEPYLDRG